MGRDIRKSSASKVDMRQSRVMELDIKVNGVIIVNIRNLLNRHSLDFLRYFHATRPSIFWLPRSAGLTATDFRNNRYSYKKEEKSLKN